MKKNILKYPLVLGIGMLMLLIIFIFIYLNRDVEAALGEDEITEMIEERFSGQVIEMDKVSLNGHPYYDVEFQSSLGVYFIKLDGVSGMIHLFNKLSDRKVVSTDDPPHELSPVSMEEIEGIIRESISPDSRIIQIQYQEEDNRQIYVVHVEQPDGLGRFEVDALTGNVLLFALDARDGEGNSEVIGELRAREIALSHVDGEVDDVDLEERDGRLIYEVEVENDETDKEAMVYIDAFTGEVLSIEWDD
ncbi:PepSY domain-containing protein [Evansella tamaricis]|uniref:PepSY domain-containing protein n=1 Tax=Evansella tamaricis TaxID=2069301 RepID=A0ABS6JIW7_9BACI|nr:PepSY domain-containing protein [Evansella tamaricis]MBU9713478.1 PepSY domain-containing protein [Evansella tamaricis]